MNTRRRIADIRKQGKRGFTIVEIIVSVVVFTIFLNGIFNLYVVGEDQRLNQLKQSVAYELASINLQKFATRPALLTVCTTISSGIDLKSYNNYFDETVATFPAMSSLGNSTGVTQSVTGFPVDGCNVTSFVSKAFKIESKVTYIQGTTTKSVTRVAYVLASSTIP